MIAAGEILVRGVIVWDFDGVLFHAKKFSVSAFAKIGIGHSLTRAIIGEMRSKKVHFSISQFIKELRRKKILNSSAQVRRIFHEELTRGIYYSPETDHMLHQMKKQGFLQYIVSMGHARFQHKKMFYGCGKSFKNHFVRTYVTTKPKYYTIQKIHRKHHGVPFFFIDDTREHLKLAKKHIPDIITIHYSNASGRSIRHLEKKILKHAKQY